jgi:hypothetical protein
LASSKIVKQIVSDENLPMIGIVVAVLGFYVIAEWQIIGGLLFAVSGYGIVLAAASTTRRFVKFLFFKLKALKRFFNPVARTNG